MKFVALRELKINPSAVLDRGKKESLIVTRNGKPAAALVPLDEDTLDEFIMANHPTFRKETEAAIAEYRRKGGIGQKEMLGRVLGKRG